MVLRLLSVFSAVPRLPRALRVCPSRAVDYIEIEAATGVESSGKIEVLEFFWYRCPHWLRSGADLEAWAKGLPRDVQFRRIPGI